MFEIYHNGICMFINVYTFGNKICLKQSTCRVTIWKNTWVSYAYKVGLEIKSGKVSQPFFNNYKNLIFTNDTKIGIVQ